MSKKQDKNSMIFIVNKATAKTVEFKLRINKVLNKILLKVI